MASSPSNNSSSPRYAIHNAGVAFTLKKVSCIPDAVSFIATAVTVAAYKYQLSTEWWCGSITFSLVKLWQM